MGKAAEVVRVVAQHYASGDLRQRVLGILAANGTDQRSLTMADVAPLDQFHTGGLKATRELAELAGIQPGSRVLDVGGGLGGAARVLASELRCQVTVVELTREYVEVGALLSEWLDLSGKVHFRCEDAQTMAFDDARFDAAWIQHSTLNMSDKDVLFSHLARMVCPHGRLAIQEIVVGEGSPTFPAPWADSPDESFLLAPADLRSLIARRGFRELAWEDVTPQALSAFRAVIPAPTDPPSLGIHLLVPAQALRNFLADLEAGRARVVRGAFQRK